MFLSRICDLFKLIQVIYIVTQCNYIKIIKLLPEHKDIDVNIEIFIQINLIIKYFKIYINHFGFIEIILNTIYYNYKMNNFELKELNFQL